MIQSGSFLETDRQYMRQALRLARRGYGLTAPNPMVGAVLVKRGKVIGRGWHHRAGEPHAEIEALRTARAHGLSSVGATLYVTLEPCCTRGRTPPCTEAVMAAGIRRVVVAATDPNPAHAGRAYELLEKAGIEVAHGLLAEEATRMNQAFNHWIVHRTPLVTVKAAMTLDGSIATATGESQWITSESARNWAMELRQGADAILAGINTVLADDPSLTVRRARAGGKISGKPRIILDSKARTPFTAKVITDVFAPLTTLVTTDAAPRQQVAVLANLVTVWTAPAVAGRIDLRWLLDRLGAQGITHLLVEGGGEVNASFLLGGLAQRVAFFYAPKILGGEDSCRAIGGKGIDRLSEALTLEEVEWRRLGPDLLLTARVTPRKITP